MNAGRKQPDEDRRHVYLTSADLAHINSLRARLQASGNPEAVRRAVITMNSLLDVQDAGGQVVLCKKGLPDKVVWFI